MRNYEQVLDTVEFALIKGEYNFCIEFLSPIIESYPISSKEGVNLRTVLITAFCGNNRKEDAKKLCKELLKSYDNKTRENAKYLMEIIDSPEIKKPDNWNIKFESNSSLKKKSLNSLQSTNRKKKEKKFINITEIPTGETKPFKKGFILIISLILLLLIPLLSGCVKIENTLDVSDINSINNNFSIENKYIKKLAWQTKFEEKLKDVIPNAEIASGESNFSIKTENLNIESVNEILDKIQNAAGEIAGWKTNIKIESIQKNFIFVKKYFYILNLDLQKISNFDNLEINFKVTSSNKIILPRSRDPKSEISNNIFVWKLIPGEINTLEFSFWSWNKLLICITFILFLIILAYSIRFYRFQIGSDLPQLPSN